MITFFNRRRLFVDSNAEAAARVWSVLKKNGIPYEMHTLRNHTTFGRNLHSSMAMNFNKGAWGHAPLADEILYTYVIYVRKRDYERARKIVHL